MRISRAYKVLDNFENISLFLNVVLGLPEIELTFFIGSHMIWICY